MNIGFIEIFERFQGFLWPFMRISALLVTAPLYSSQAVGLRVRIVFALVLTLMVYPMLTWPQIDPSTSAGFEAAVGEVLLGVTMGLVLQLVTAAVTIGGQSMSASIGLSMANMIDPNLGNVPVVSQFLVILSALVFLAFGGHAVLVALLIESFRLMPVGQSLLGTTDIESVLRWSSMMFVGGLLIALPVMAVLLLMQIGLGVVTRAAPSLNIFAVGFPALLLAGFLVMMTSMSSTVYRIEWLWIEAFARLRELIGAA